MGKFLRSRLKKALNRGEGEPSKRDFPLIKAKLVAHSMSDDYKKAKHEWQFIGIVEEDDVARFTNRCELCNQAGLRLNFEIYNSDTNKSLLVGSTCIGRFIILKGTSNEAESWDYFVSEAKKLANYTDLCKLLPAVLVAHPESRDVMLFRRMAEEILGSFSPGAISRKQWDEFTNQLLGPATSQVKDLERIKKLDRIREILFNPRKVPVKKPQRLDTGQAAGHWASKGRRKARVATTLVSSDAYKDPSKRV